MCSLAKGVYGGGRNRLAAELRQSAPAPSGGGAPVLGWQRGPTEEMGLGEAKLLVGSICSGCAPKRRIDEATPMAAAPCSAQAQATTSKRWTAA